MAKIVESIRKDLTQRYSDILLNLLRGNYTSSLALAYAIPVHLGFSSLPKRVSLLDGIKVVLNNPATLYVNIREEYEVGEYNRHKDFVPCYGDTVFDVGAYVGLYALRSARRVVDSLVYAFEPNPSAFTYLVTNVEINGLRNVKCFPTALSDRIGTTCLYTANDINIEASSFWEFHIKKWARKVSKIKVKTDTVDNFIKRRGISRIDVAKIDVEGAEEFVLRGAKNALCNGVIEKLIIEVHETVIPTNKIVGLLAGFNYRVKYLLRYPSGIKSIVYAKLAG